MISDGRGIHADPICDERSQHTTDRAGSGHSPKVESACVHEVTGERHDDLRWQWNACRLDPHQQNDAGVTERRNRRNDQT